MRRPKRSPWGVVQDFKQLADGIAEVGTPSHGGIKLDPQRNAAMPDCARCPGGWYEEDCEWALVALVFPDAFKATDQQAARDRVRNQWPEIFTAVTGELATLENSRELRRRSWAETTRESFVACCAYGDWHEAVPAGHVGVTAKRESDGETATFLLAAANYRRTSEFGTVVPMDAEHWDMKVAS